MPGEIFHILGSVCSNASYFPHIFGSVLPQLNSQSTPSYINPLQSFTRSVLWIVAGASHLAFVEIRASHISHFAFHNCVYIHSVVTVYKVKNPKSELFTFRLSLFHSVYGFVLVRELNPSCSLPSPREKYLSCRTSYTERERERDKTSTLVF